MTRTITRRPVAAVIALAAMLAAVALAMVPTGANAAAPAPGVTVVGSTADCGPARHWHIATNGAPYLLPWCGEEDGANAVHYRDAVTGAPLWLRGERLDPAPAPVVRVAKPAVTADPAIEGKAPVLSLNATPSTTGIPVKWTAADAPGDDTVVGYQVRYRKTTVTSWTTAGDLANVLTTTVAGLVPGTRYEVQVRARYGTSAAGAYGPWSNSVFSTTDDLATE